MKRLYSLFCLTAILCAALGLSSCGDNDDVSREHTLTDEEMAELARQDSLTQAQLASINADLILSYTVSFTISSLSYDGTSLEIDLDQIAELFGISSTTELVEMIDNYDVTPFAIEGSTHADNMTSSNVNTAWGHYWDASGDVATWGDSDSMVFTEFEYDEDYTGAYFSCGQYPGRLSGGEEITVIEALSYGGKRVAIQITFLPQAQQEVVAGVVNTQYLTLNAVVDNSYVETGVQFDLAQVYSDLGVSSPDDFTILGLNTDGSYNTELATGSGFWHNAEGYVCNWGDGSILYTAYREEIDDGVYLFDDDYIGIGQYPGACSEGDQYKVYYAFMANDKIEMFDITVNIISYEDPETPLTGTPTSSETDIVLTKDYSNDYANVTSEDDYDVQEIMRQTFQMTTYEIYKAIYSGEMKLYVDEVADGDPEYTSDEPGYWLDADGASCYWSSGIVFCCLYYSYESIYLYMGCHPDNCSSTTTYQVTTKYVFEYEGTTATFNITMNVNATE